MKVLASKVRRIAGRLPRYCYDVAENLYWDAKDLDKGIYPGSARSWRSQDIPLLGG
jgi:hypothetical protein